MYEIILNAVMSILIGSVVAIYTHIKHDDTILTVQVAFAASLAVFILFSICSSIYYAPE